MQKQYGYPALTPKVKKQIFGLNAARLYGVGKQGRKFLCEVPADALTRAQADNGGFRAGRSMRVYGAQTRRDFFRMFAERWRA
jgi:hypothetical protein